MSLFFFSFPFFSSPNILLYSLALIVSPCLGDWLFWLNDDLLLLLLLLPLLIHQFWVTTTITTFAWDSLIAACNHTTLVFRGIVLWKGELLP